MGREPESATFEPVRVAGGARRSSGALAAWLVCLLGIAGLAAFNAAPAADETDPPIAAIATRAPTIAPGLTPSEATPSGRPIAIVDIVESRSVDPDEGELSRRLEVAGLLFVAADRVRITLEGREDHIIATVVKRQTRLFVQAGPVAPLPFVASFELPAWQGGGMWITVTAFDDRGERIGRIRERVEVYPFEPLA